MTKKEYAEKFKDPRWQKMRLKVFDRDAWSCRECTDAENTLHAHHLYYENGNDPWAYPSEDIITLCEKCHEKLKGKNKKPIDKIEDMYELDKEEVINHISSRIDVYFTKSEAIIIDEIIESLHDYFPKLTHHSCSIPMMLSSSYFIKFLVEFSTNPSELNFNKTDSGETILSVTPNNRALKRFKELGILPQPEDHKYYKP